MSEMQLPAVITKIEPAALFAALRDAWIAQMGAPPARASLLVLIAQWALETGWGRACYCWNLGNVRHAVGDGRAYCLIPCSEVIEGKEYKYDPTHPEDAKHCMFRAFETLEAGTADYLATIWKNFDKAWPAVVKGDPAGYAVLLKAQGYFTANLSLYEKALVALFAKLDKELGPLPAAAPVGVATSVVPPQGQPTPPADLKA